MDLLLLWSLGFWISIRCNMIFNCDCEPRTINWVGNLTFFRIGQFSLGVTSIGSEQLSISSDIFGRFFFWVGLWKPTAETCALCRGGWEWLDGTPLDEGLFEWGSNEPGANDRYNRLRGCGPNGYQLWPTSQYNKQRYLCSRGGSS